VVPIIGLFNQTNLITFLEDKKAWPIYVTIGNICSWTSNSSVKIPVLVLALLPVSPKLTGESTCVDEAQWQIYVDSLWTVFELVFALLQQLVQHQQKYTLDHYTSWGIGGKRGQIIKLQLLYKERTVGDTMYTMEAFGNMRRVRNTIVIQAK